MFFEIHPSDDGQFYWTLSAANNKVLGQSETMHNYDDAMDIVEKIKVGLSADTRVVDRTGRSG